MRRVEFSLAVSGLLGLVLSGLLGLADSQLQTASEQQLQCYACGLPKVHPENDIIGSYGTVAGKKMYNHSCAELMDTIVDGKVDKRFLRTCPQGVKSCFGAFGFYNHNDEDPSNDIHVRFLGCSEAKYRHDYGCDKELQNVDIRDKANRKTQVEISVNLCFCSEHTCNHPDGELFADKNAGSNPRPDIAVTAAITTLLLATLNQFA